LVNLDDQFRLDDPYGRECTKENCIYNLLRATSGFDLNPEEAVAHKRGYRYVETTDPVSGQNFRYTASIRQGWNIEAIERYKKEWRSDPPRTSYRFQLDRVEIPKLTARYGITWADVSTREDRENWVAGGALRVIDLRSNAVIAERIGYMADRARGSRVMRIPWAMAQEDACPEFPALGAADPRRVRRDSQTLDFVVKVLQPSY
jgi:hypothetical protein